MHDRKLPRLVVAHVDGQRLERVTEVVAGLDGVECEQVGGLDVAGHRPEVWVVIRSFAHEIGRAPPDLIVLRANTERMSLIMGKVKSFSESRRS